MNGQRANGRRGTRQPPPPLFQPPLVLPPPNFPQPNIMIALVEMATVEARLDFLSRDISEMMRRLYVQVVNESPPLPPVNARPYNQQRSNPVAAIVAGRDPMDVLSVPAWREVLGEIKDLEILHNCMGMCPLFENILRPRKQEILTYNHLIYSWFSTYFSATAMQTLLHQYPVAVHQFFQNHASLRPFQSGNEYNVNYFVIVNPLKHYGWVPTFDFRVNGINSVIQPPVLGATRYEDSPFLGDQLCLVPRMNQQDEDTEDNLMWQTVSQFLQLHGQHVKYFTLMLEERPRRGYGIHASDLLVEGLPELLPHLRRLAVTGCLGKGNPNIPPAVVPSVLPLSSLETLDLRCGRRPFPVSCGNCPTSPVVNRLINIYNLQLGKLHLSVGMWTGVASKFCWPKLTELSLEAVSDAFDFTSLRTCVHMPMLEKIGIEGDVRILDRVEACLGILREIVNNSATVNTLALGGIWMDLLPWTVDRVNIFPLKLQTLIIDLAAHDFSSFMFLISRFPFLENVHVYVGEYQNVPNRATGIVFRTERNRVAENYFGTVQCYDSDQVLHLNRAIYRGELYSSNVWRWMPKLDTFTYQYRGFNRHDYDHGGAVH